MNKKTIAGGALLLSAFAAILVFLGACKQPTDNTEEKEPVKSELTGTVSIDGVMKVGETLTANIQNSNGTAGRFTYQWTRTADGATLNINEANGPTYVIAGEDVNRAIGVIVANHDMNGTISTISAENVIEEIIAICEHDANSTYNVNDTACEADECNIQPQNIFYGELTLRSGAKVQVFRASDVTVEQVNDILPRIQEAHDGMDVAGQQDFETNKPSKIVVIDNANYTWSNDSRVLGLRQNRTVGQIGAYLGRIVNGSITETEDQPIYAQARANNDVRLAMDRPANRLSVAPQANKAWKKANQFARSQRNPQIAKINGRTRLG